MALDKTYNPADYEADIYTRWEQSGAFKKQASQSNQPPFVVVLPPPNANADLHLGYALDSQLKDILARWARLQGRSVLLIPGADHAGFETWAVYEKYLASQGKTRFDYSDDELYQQVYDFVQDNMANMKNQIRRLGISCDWDSFVFSLDNQVVNRTYATFKQMWEEDLIYRGKRLVNYCIQHSTGFSDIEVTHQLKAGKLWFIKYPTIDNQSYLTIATTRPETMFGDVAVAVHPEDERYVNFHNQSLQLPLTGRTIPVICDERVKTDFGTGAVKITPGHDFLDFEIGQTANLEPLEIINQQGQIQAPAPVEFVGMSREEARKMAVAKLREQGLLVEEQDYEHQVGCCYKCGEVLEPLLVNQWFVRMQPLAQKAIEQLQQNKIKFHPQSKLPELITYLQQLKDWNISRQIVWGIRIPVFQNEANESDWIFNDQVQEDVFTINGQTYRRDPDVFDTWWSSGQWPFAAINQTETDLYPQALMETGVDILRPWVSRMILLGLYVTSQLPFETVYLHGMVVDEKGVKMSKSKGNVVNPMNVIEEYGTDALRVALCGQIAPAQPQRFTTGKVIAGRNFCNKLWNIGRFIQNAKQTDTTDKAEDFIANHWIWQRLNQTKEEVDRHLTNYQFTLTWQKIYDFVWHDLADWYLEVCKVQFHRDFVQQLMLHVLQLVHPFAPFVSEAIYSELYPEKDSSLMNNVWNIDYQVNFAIDQDAVQCFAEIQVAISNFREIMPFEIRQKGQLLFLISGFSQWGEGEPQHSSISFFNQYKLLFKQLTQIPIKTHITKSTPHLLIYRTDKLYQTDKGCRISFTADQILLQQQRQKLQIDLQKKEDMHSRLKQRFSNPAYEHKAPRELVLATNRQLLQLDEEMQVLKKKIAQFKESTEPTHSESD